MLPIAIKSQRILNQEAKKKEEEQKLRDLKEAQTELAQSSTSLRVLDPNIPHAILEKGLRYQPLAAHTYHNATENVPSGWQVLGDFNHPAGWLARAYKSDSGEYAVAFRGTYSLKEFLFLDSTLILGMLPSLKDMDSWLKNLVGSDLSKVTFTGHSLGGTLASAKSVVSDSQAYVFDSAGVPGYSQQALSRVYDFESELNLVNGGLLYEKGQVYKLPLPPHVVKNIEVRKAYLEQLNKLYFVQNDATRAIHSAYALFTQVQNLLDVHSIRNIGESMSDLNASLQQYKNLNAPAYSDEFSGAKESRGSYAIQMNYQVQSAIDYANKIAQSSSEKLFQTNKKSAQAAIQNAKSSLEIYEQKCNPDSKEKDSILLMKAELNDLENSLSNSNNYEDFLSKKSAINEMTSNIKRQMDGAKSGVEKAVKYLNDDKNRKQVLDWGYDILAGFGIKVSEKDKEIWDASSAMLFKLASDFNTYRADSRDYAYDSQYLCLQGPTPGQKFLASSLENLSGFFEGMAVIGRTFGNEKIEKIANIAGPAISIAMEIGKIAGMIPMAFTPVGAVATIAVATISLFNALSGKAKKQKSQAESMQKALAQISEQIAALHEEMRKSFEQVFKNQQALLEYLSSAFAAISKNFESTLERLDDIQKFIRGIEEQLAKAEISSNLMIFDDVKNASNAVQNQLYAPRDTKNPQQVQTEEQVILDTTSGLVSFLESKVSAPVFTGDIFPSLSNNKNTDMLELNRRTNLFRHDFIISHFLAFFEHYYPESGLRQYASSDILNVMIWSSAIAHYVRILEHKPEIINGYPIGLLNKFQEKGRLFLKLITDLRKNDPFMDSVFSDFEKTFQNLMMYFREKYYEIAPLEYEPSDEKAVALSEIKIPEKNQKNFERDFSIALEHNYIVRNLAHILGGVSVSDFIEGYFSQKQKRFYESYQHTSELLKTKPKQILTRHCLIENIPHLAIFYYHPINNANARGQISFELLNLKTRKMVLQKIYYGAPTSQIHTLHIDDISITHETIDEKKSATIFHVIGRVADAYLLNISFDRTSNPPNANWRKSGDLYSPTENAKVFSHVSSNNILNAFAIQFTNKNLQITIPALIRCEGENYRVIPLLASRASAAYSHLEVAAEGDAAWFVVADVVYGAAHNTTNWRLYEIADIKNDHIVPIATPDFADKIFDKTTYTNIAVRLEVVNGIPYVLFACTDQGLRLYSYDKSNKKWSLLLNNPDTFNSAAGWNGVAHRPTLTMKKTSLEEPNEEIHDGLVITVKSARCEEVLFYSIKHKKLLQTALPESERINFSNTPHVFMVGPLWGKTYNEDYNTLTTGLTILPRNQGDNNADQDTLIFVSRNPTKENHLDIQAYTLFENSQRMRNNFSVMENSVRDNLKNCDPQTFTLKDELDFLPTPIVPVHLLENSQVELREQYIISDDDYTFLSLGTTRKEVSNILQTKLQEEGNNENSVFKELLGYEISTILLASFITQPLEPSSALGYQEKNIWSWLKEDSLEANNIVKERNQAAIELDKHLKSILENPLEGEGHTKSLMEELIEEPSLETAFILEREIEKAEAWEKNRENPEYNNWVFQWKKWLQNPFLTPEILKNKLHFWRGKLENPNSSIEKNELALISLCKEKRLDWTKGRLSPTAREELEVKINLQEAKEKEWKDFCEDPEVQKNYITSFENSQNGLPLGLYTAYLYLASRITTGETVYVVEMDKDMSIVLPEWSNAIDFLPNAKIWILAKNSGHGFSLMHRKEDLPDAMANPRYASSMETGLRNADSILSTEIALRAIPQSNNSLKEKASNSKTGETTPEMAVLTLYRHRNPKENLAPIPHLKNEEPPAEPDITAEYTLIEVEELTEAPQKVHEKLEKSTETYKITIKLNTHEPQETPAPPPGMLSRILSWARPSS